MQSNECTADTPVNNDCTNATFIPSLPFFETGETNGATTNENAVDDETDACNAVDKNSRIVWYELEGDGSCFTASTSGSTFNTGLEVYTGECGTLECMKGNDNVGPGDETSELSWETEIGVRYKLAVGGNGYFNNSGFYELNVTVSG